MGTSLHKLIATRCWKLVPDAMSIKMWSTAEDMIYMVNVTTLLLAGRVERQHTSDELSTFFSAACHCGNSRT